MPVITTGIFRFRLRGLTNAEAVTEVSKKIEILATKRRENNRATILEDGLRRLLSKTGDLNQGEMFDIIGAMKYS